MAASRPGSPPPKKDISWSPNTTAKKNIPASLSKHCSRKGKFPVLGDRPTPSPAIHLIYAKIYFVCIACVGDRRLSRSNRQRPGQNRYPPGRRQARRLPAKQTGGKRQ